MRFLTDFLLTFLFIFCAAGSVHTATSHENGEFGVEKAETTAHRAAANVE